MTPEQRALTTAVVVAQTRETAALDALVEASTPQERETAQAEVAAASQARQEAEEDLADAATDTAATLDLALPPAGTPATAPGAVTTPLESASPVRSTQAVASSQDGGVAKGPLAALVAGIALLLVVIVREFAR